MTPYAPASAYRANAVLTASSPQLIVMLYDGARRFLHQAGVAMAEKDIADAHNKLRAAEHILRHLRNTLDMSQGEIPANLSAIYTFSLRQCQRARFDQNPKLLEQVSDLLGQLRMSWATIADRHDAAQGAGAQGAAAQVAGPRAGGGHPPVAVLAG
ncbi:MAG TPA: flagellar export chaperone FliS [Solirubrobacteraceae bacterium]|nr:flagellar export chaperone FliS [Solirubrobacteraceae bacterium]